MKLMIIKQNNKILYGLKIKYGFKKTSVLKLYYFLDL
jgi:hypothetical protein